LNTALTEGATSSPEAVHAANSRSCEENATDVMSTARAARISQTLVAAKVSAILTVVLRRRMDGQQDALIFNRPLVVNLDGLVAANRHHGVVAASSIKQDEQQRSEFRSAYFAE
jgi:hypothetical protein